VILAMSSESLLNLAKSRQPADRERLLLAIADLCDAPNGSEAMKTPANQALLSSIFMSLVVEAERSIRHLLSQRLARADWAPNALINILALDEIEIARPIIAFSPVLEEHDLVRLLVEATIEHQIEVARRPRLTPTVVAAILEQAEPAVLTALASNDTAELSPSDMDELVEISRHVAAMRTPLSEHPRLTDTLARRLYFWVGVALREGLVDRFRLDAAALDEALAASVAEAHTGHMAGAQPGKTREGELDAMEQRLIDKLHAAGQLRPAYLIRALREGRLGLFVAALASLGGFETAQVQAGLNSDRPELLALACVAVGIDRSAFPDILEMVRKLNQERPGGGAEGARKAAVAFAPVTTEVAAAAFREAVSALSLETC
jgi:uncharacterized protein (DUF2336 family)